VLLLCFRVGGPRSWAGLRSLEGGSGIVQRNENARRQMLVVDIR